MVQLEIADLRVEYKQEQEQQQQQQ